jgi:hypothetical protein
VKLDLIKTLGLDIVFQFELHGFVIFSFGKPERFFSTAREFPDPYVILGQFRSLGAARLCNNACTRPIDPNEQFPQVSKAAGGRRGDAFRQNLATLNDFRGIRAIIISRLLR